MALSRRVLIVEDDREIRDAISDSLADLGVESIPARDGVEGLEKLEEGPAPQAILLDLCLPRLDGHGFLRAMRARPEFADIPVISMTASTHADHPAAANAHLRKPFDFEDLARILASLCE